jgi:hypothetical protein
LLILGINISLLKPPTTLPPTRVIVRDDAA